MQFSHPLMHDNFTRADMNATIKLLKQKNFIKHFRKLITIPFKFSSGGSTILFKNIDKKII